MSKKKAAKPIGTKPAAKAQGVKRGEPAKAGARPMPPAKSAKAPVKPAAKVAAKAPASAKGEAKTVKGAAPKGAAVVKTGGKTASAPARTMAAAREEPAKKTQGESKKMPWADCLKTKPIFAKKQLMIALFRKPKIKF